MLPPLSRSITRRQSGWVSWVSRAFSSLQHQRNHKDASDRNIWTPRTRDAEHAAALSLKKGKDPGDHYKERYTIAVKDNITTTKGFTTCASKILTNHTSPFEASVVNDFLRRPQITSPYLYTRKANLDEFGMGSHSTNTHFGTVQNLWPHEGRSTGGSSGGSAMAVATGQSRFGLGTDTGGSVRLPAAYTGTVGFKPSYGNLSRWGVVPYANSLDTVGIIAKDVDSVMAAMRKVNHFDPKDPTSFTAESRKRVEDQLKDITHINTKLKASIKNKRLKTKKSGKDPSFLNVKFGVPMEYNIAEMDDSVRQAWNDALTILQNLGATIVPISLPTTKHALPAYYILAPAEAASNLAKYDGVRYGSRQGELWDGRGDVLYSETRGEGFGDEVKRRILLGSYTLSSDAIDNYFIKAQKIRRLVQQDFDRVFVMANPSHEAEQYDLSDMDESVSLDDKLGPTQVDFIITPTAPTPPPKLETIHSQTPVDAYMNDVFTVPASLAGIPAISIPFPCLRPQHQVVPGGGFVGIQFMGQYSDDFRLLNVARMFEASRKRLGRLVGEQQNDESQQ